MIIIQKNYATMNNTYLSECEVRLPGIQKAKQLAVLLRSKGYLQSTSPIETPRNRYEFYPYRVVCYHSSVEKLVKKFMEEFTEKELEFKVLHE